MNRVNNMKYIIDVPDGIHKKITKLIADGEYATMQDFALIAIQNQFLIEDTSTVGNSYKEKYGIVDSITLNPKETRWSSPDKINKLKIRTLTSSIKSYDWLFGQVNRVLPIKFGLRILISYLEEYGSELDLDWFLEKAADQAREFGIILKKREDEKNLLRYEKISIGFPIGNEEKSLNRYKSHFLGYKQLKTDHSVGALPELGFAVISQGNNGENKISITDGGLQFGLLENPVIDGNYLEKSISNEESSFYLQHILKHAPGEVKALGMIISMIYENLNQPNKMNDEIAKRYPKWSKAKCVTNRSGAIGRAVDLGLVQRNRKGNEVTYQLSYIGNSIYEKHFKQIDF